MLGAGGAVLTLLVAGVAYWYGMQRPPAPTADPVTLVKFAATPRFMDMPEDQKEPYLRAIQHSLPQLITAAKEQAFTAEERTGAFHNLFRSRARLEARTYFNQSDPMSRAAQLDQLIEEQELLRRSDPHDGSAPTLVQMKQFVEALPPEERVQMASLAFGLIKRRTARGLTALPFVGSKN